MKQGAPSAAAILLNRIDRREAVKAITTLSLERFDAAVSPDFYWTDNQPRIAIFRSGKRQPSALPEVTLTRAEAVQLATWLRRTEKRLSELYGARS
jgi:hypothetical protein